jgi:hypothetical protein
MSPDWFFLGVYFHLENTEETFQVLDCHLFFYHYPGS